MEEEVKSVSDLIRDYIKKEATYSKIAPTSKKHNGYKVIFNDGTDIEIERNKVILHFFPSCGEYYFICNEEKHDLDDDPICSLFLNRFPSKGIIVDNKYLDLNETTSYELRPFFMGFKAYKRLFDIHLVRFSFIKDFFRTEIFTYNKDYKLEDQINILSYVKKIVNYIDTPTKKYENWTLYSLCLITRKFGVSGGKTFFDAYRRSSMMECGPINKKHIDSLYCKDLARLFDYFTYDLYIQGFTEFNSALFSQYISYCNIFFEYYKRMPDGDELYPADLVTKTGRLKYKEAIKEKLDRNFETKTINLMYAHHFFGYVIYEDDDVVIRIPMNVHQLVDEIMKCTYDPLILDDDIDWRISSSIQFQYIIIEKKHEENMNLVVRIIADEDLTSGIKVEENRKKELDFKIFAKHDPTENDLNYVNILKEKLS